MNNSPDKKFYDMAKEKMRYLKNKNRNFRINSILPKVENSYLEELVGLADEVSADINFFIYRPFGRNSHLKEIQDLAPSLDEWFGYLKKLEQLKEEFPNVNITTNNYDILQKKDLNRFRLLMDFHKCPTSEEFFTITPNGDVYSCGFMYYHNPKRFKIGNTEFNDLWDLWKDDSKWGIFRESKTSSTCPTCDYFKGEKCYGHCVAEEFFIKKYPRLKGKYVCNLPKMAES